MADFNKAMEFTLRWEGGLVDHPDDPGGLTNRGITFRVFSDSAQVVLGIEPTRENLISLSEAEAKAIYKAKFWDRIKGDDITDQDVATAIFDFLVNITSVAIPTVQQLLNVEFGQSLAVDGILGPKTIEAINSVDADELYDRINQAREIYYHYRADDLGAGFSYWKAFFSSLGISQRDSQKVFLKGWINRVLALGSKLKKKVRWYT